MEIIDEDNLEFIGKLEELDPKKIINIKDNNKLDKFFLLLGLIYNDFKSLSFYTLLLDDKFKKEKLNEVSLNSGEYYGMKNHLRRLMISTIHEFLMFLDFQSRIIKSDEFRILLSKLSHDERNLWQQMLDIANKQNLTQIGSRLVETLKDIRNRGSFHYFDAGNEIRNGFIDHFYNRYNQHESNKTAYYSKGDRMKDIRYFYCDAAIQGYNYICGGGELSYADYSKGVVELIEKMNVIIIALMKSYIDDRK